MHVSRLSLTDFRNYEHLDLDLSPGVTVFLGPNGQGKTNLVEAIGFFSVLGSHRTASDAALVRRGADRAIVRLRVRHLDRELSLDAEIAASGSNRAKVAGKPVKLRELPAHHATVMFAPEDLAIVRGDPAGRRRFLDELLVQLRPATAGVLADYERVLKQRSTLLKSARANRTPASALSTLDVWGDRMIQLGVELELARVELVRMLEPHFRAAIGALTERDHEPRMRLSLSILAGGVDEDGGAELGADDAVPEADALAERFRERLVAVRSAELDRGVNLVGPHRDDLVLELNSLPVRGYASHGESWTAALALRLAAAELLRAVSRSGDPVLMLDDVFAELDESRRRRLAGAVASYEQVLITAAVPGDVPDELDSRTVVRIRSGRVEAA